MMLSERNLANDELPLACSLSGAEQVTREVELAELFKGMQQVEELADGYALKFPGDEAWANRLLQFIAFERACCPFFTFAMIFEAAQGPTWLHIRGPEEVKGMIRDMMKPL